MTVWRDALGDVWLVSLYRGGGYRRVQVAQTQVSLESGADPEDAIQEALAEWGNVDPDEYTIEAEIHDPDVALSVPRC